MAQATEILVDVVHHGGVELLVAGEEFLLLVGEVGPGFYSVVFFSVAWRQLSAAWYDTHFELAGETLAAYFIPSFVETAAVFFAILGFDLQGGVGCGVGEVKKPRFGGVAGAHLVHHVEGLVGEVVGEVVAVGVLVSGYGVVVLVNAVRVMKVGESVEYSVETIKSSLAGPRVLGPGFTEVGVFTEVPFANHQGGPAGVAKCFGHGDGVLAEFHSEPGEAGGTVAHSSYASHVVVEAGE